MISYPPALFSYSVTPNAVPYTDDPSSPSTVGLMIAVNNGTGQNVDCSRLVFTLPVGTGAGALTNDPSAINAAPALGTPWSITSDKAGSFTALPQAPVTGLNAGDSIAFSLSGIPINQLPGLAEITIYEGANPIRQTQVGVSKLPPGLAITSFSANPIQVAPGSTAELSWTTTAATSATLSWAGQSVPVSVNGQYSVTPQETTTYILTATGDGSVAQEITVTVPRVQILSFGASPTNVAQNGTSTLAWQVINADTCHIEPGDISVDPNQGTHIVNPDQTSTYVLEAAGYGHTVSMSTVVNVLPVVINSFTATPDLITLGQFATLQWATVWASGCSIDQGVGPVQVSGSLQVSPQNTTTYTLTAQGLCGPVQHEAQVRVNSVAITSFTANPSNPADPNTPVTLSWVTNFATSCQITPGVGPVDLSGSVVVYPTDTTTYVLTAQGPNGPATQLVTVTLPPVQITTFTVSPSQLCDPDNVSITWGTLHAISITLTIFDPNGSSNGATVNASGEQQYYCDENGTYKFELSCTGPAGPVSATQNVEEFN